MGRELEKMRVALCIPTLNAGTYATKLIDGINSQTLRPRPFLVIDSGSSDGTGELFEKAGATVVSIRREQFNHGATRQLAVNLADDADVLIFLTQDAIPAATDGFERLVECFKDSNVSAAYGRQLPRAGAGLIETHARQFNYPAQTRTRTLADRHTLGIKVAFISNSFAAWRRSHLLAIGGFPRAIIMGEDTWAAARLLLAGRKVTYCAESTVYHSHEYDFGEEFRRYFDTGVLHAREPWIRREFGRAEGEGLRFVASELSYLGVHNPLLIPSALTRTFLKWAGFRLGLFEARIPVRLKRRLSMLGDYWLEDPSPGAIQIDDSCARRGMPSDDES
jgi:rhamnosyltransferase